MRRTLTAGTTDAIAVEPFPSIRSEATRIATALKPLGPCNVQMRVVDDRPVCFEINVRFSGTTPMRARLGFNDVEATLRHYVLNEPPVDLPEITSGYALRLWRVRSTQMPRRWLSSKMAVYWISLSSRSTHLMAGNYLDESHGHWQYRASRSCHSSPSPAASGHLVVGLSRHSGSGIGAEHVVADISDPQTVNFVIATTQPCDAIVQRGSVFGL